MPRKRSSWSVKGAPRTERSVPSAEPPNGYRPVATATAARPKASPARTRRVVGIALICGATLLVLVASLGVLAVRGHGGSSAADVPPPPATEPAQAYTVTYRVDDSAGPQVRHETDYLAVQRPYDVRLEHRDGPPPGGTVLSGSIVTHTDSVTLGGSADGFTTPHAPEILPGLLSRSALDSSVDAGKAQSRGDSTIVGERCTHYVYNEFGSEPIGSSDSQAIVDSCVTPDSIVLREVIHFAGKLVRSSEAVALDRSPRFGPDAFRPAKVITPDSPEQISDEIISGPPRGTEKALAVQVPGGFHLDVAANIGHQLGPDAPPVLYYTQSFVGAGGEQIIVDQPQDDSGESPWTGHGGFKIDIGNGQPSEILYHAGYIEIDTRVGGLPVRVMAPRSDLAIYVARQLRLPT